MADIHMFEGEDIVETLAAQAEGHEPGELGALAYHLYDTNPELTEEEAFEAFTNWVADRGIELWPHQEEALMSLMVGDHVILGTPTGSGKSLVALGMHFMAMCFGETSYYTAPIKALVSEKFFNLVELLGRDNVGMITGDSPHQRGGARSSAVPRRFSRTRRCAKAPDALVHSVAMDEFHFFSDTGPRLGMAGAVAHAAEDAVLADERYAGRRRLRLPIMLSDRPTPRAMSLTSPMPRVRCRFRYEYALDPAGGNGRACAAATDEGPTVRRPFLAGCGAGPARRTLASYRRGNQGAARGGRRRPSKACAVLHGVRENR